MKNSSHIWFKFDIRPNSCAKRKVCFCSAKSIEHFFSFRGMEVNEDLAVNFTVNADINERFTDKSAEPRKSQIIQDVQREWALLEFEINSRDVALKNEVLHLEHLVQLAYNFRDKVMTKPNVLSYYCTVYNPMASLIYIKL